MSRLTRPKDRWECRIAGGCPVEEWLATHDVKIEDEIYFCEDCPFEKYINKLAEYDDAEEKIEDDGK